MFAMGIDWEFGPCEVLLEFGGNILAMLLLAGITAVAYIHRHRRPRSSRYFLAALLLGLGEQAWESQIMLASNYLPFALGVSTFVSPFNHPLFEIVYMVVMLTFQVLIWTCVLAAAFLEETPPENPPH